LNPFETEVVPLSTLKKEKKVKERPELEGQYFQGEIF
jgi:hypothetical protein